NTDQLGGLGAPENGHRHAFVLFDRPGSNYVLFDDSGNVPRRVVHLTVTANSGPQTLPATTKTVVAKTDRRFGGDSTLPAQGDVLFKNNSTESPHFLVLQRVKDGTTRKQVVQSFSTDAPPSFVLPGEQESDAIGKGDAMVLHLNLKPGTYAE